MRRGSTSAFSSRLCGEMLFFTPRRRSALFYIGIDQPSAGSLSKGPPGARCPPAWPGRGCGGRAPTKPESPASLPSCVPGYGRSCGPFPLAEPRTAAPGPVSHTVILSIFRFGMAFTCCSTSFGNCSMRSSVGPTRGVASRTPRSVSGSPSALASHHPAHEPRRLGLVLGQDRVGLALSFAPALFPLRGLGGDLDPLLLDLLGDDLLTWLEAGRFARSRSARMNLASDALGHGHIRPTLALCLDFRQLRVALDHARSGRVSHRGPRSPRPRRP